MLFPVSGVETSVFVPPLVALVISFFTSMGGVSGAFLLLPFQMSVLGYTSPSVSGTNQVYNIVAIPSGVYRYIREGRMVWPLTWATVIGTMPGVFLGAYIRVRWLPDAKDFKLFAALVLLYIGSRLVYDTFLRKAPAKAPAAASPGAACDFRVCDTSFSLSRVSFSFQGVTHGFSTPGVFLMCFIVGIVGGTYGIGGGAIIAPFFVAFFGLPVHAVAGASLMGTLITSVCGVTFYQLIAPWYPDMAVAPDWRLGLLFGLGGFAGMYLGARCQKWVPAKYIKTLLSACIVFMGIKYVIDYLK